MNLTRVLQPYVCCLGNPVAGNPTQFVMYRAARACGVDWRFFTSQVEVDQFETAFRGVQALGLSGAALFEPFQSHVMPLLDSVTESAICMGRVNVARLDGRSWLGDNTLGAGIINCIEPWLEFSSQTSPTEKDLAESDNQSTILVIGDMRISKVMRLASPTIAKRIVFASEGMDLLPKPSEPNDTRLDELKQPMQSVTLEEFSNSGSRVNCLVLTSVPNATISRQIAGLSWSNSAACLMLDVVPEKQMRLWRESVKVPNMSHIEQVDLMAHRAAVDFCFWTGIRPSVDMMRDSFEEYLQW